jgi:hypothetical protein
MTEHGVLCAWCSAASRTSIPFRKERRSVRQLIRAAWPDREALRQRRRIAHVDAPILEEDSEPSRRKPARHATWRATSEPEHRARRERVRPATVGRGGRSPRPGRCRDRRRRPKHAMPAPCGSRGVARAAQETWRARRTRLRNGLADLGKRKPCLSGGCRALGSGRGRGARGDAHPGRRYRFRKPDAGESRSGPGRASLARGDITRDAGALGNRRRRLRRLEAARQDRADIARLPGPPRRPHSPNSASWKLASPPRAML